jgi:hypothetical protein
MKCAIVGCCALAAFAAAPVAARTVNYNQSDENFQEDAAAIGAPSPEPAPERGRIHVILDGAERIDHRLVVLGISCSAWRVDNPLSQMVRRALTEWDADGLLDGTDAGPVLRVTLTNASSDIRCVEVREMDMSCIVRTRIQGEIRLEQPNSEPLTEPLIIEDQQIQSTPGACGSLSRGTGLSGRAASIALIERLQAFAVAR